ncbi:MAG TPA: ABC transporter permease [Spirochaetota bacterium]|nr:ABC transporter permease [Spirochaetota bacterium]
MIKRIWTLFVARNREFIRDRSAFGWNIAFPFLIVLGFGLMFSQDRQVLYKAGIVTAPAQQVQRSGGDNSLTKGPFAAEKFAQFKKTRYVEYITFPSQEHALKTLAHHRIDILINPAAGQYWINSSSPKGYIAERLLLAAGSNGGRGFTRQIVQGREIPYIEWLFPGVLGMNMMFSALFGVGYVVVRYRKNGVLKRMSVTPLRPWEFLTAQIISRMFLLLGTTAVVYIGCALIFGFQCRGSYGTLLFIFSLGGFSMISLGLLVASRSSSEEFAGGILNLITWPMMFLSEVWISLEGAHPWVKKLSLIFPLTPMIDGARKVMNDGAGIYDLKYQIISLSVMSALFMIIGSFMFKWQKE